MKIGPMDLLVLCGDCGCAHKFPVDSDIILEKLYKNLEDHDCAGCAYEAEEKAKEEKDKTRVIKSFKLKQEE